MNYIVAWIKLAMVLFVSTISANENAVNELREMLLDYMESNRDQFDDIDIERVRTIRTIAKRSYDHNRGHIHEALHELISGMKWRKTFGVNRLTNASFPEEFYTSGTVIIYGKDLEGRPLLIIRVKAIKDVEENWTELWMKFFVYLIDRITQENDISDNRGATIVLDCKDVTFENINFELIRFGLSLRQYFPMIIRSIVVHELPGAMNYMSNMVIMWLPEWQKNLVHIVENQKIDGYIARDQLPDFLGGTSAVPYRTSPDGVLTARQLGQWMNIDEDDTERMIYHLKPFIEGRI